MKLNEITGTSKAVSFADFLASIKDGKFTKDGSHLIAESNFNCAHTNLSSLIGCPQKIGGNFYCSFNKLTSLVGGPKEVKGSVFSYENRITSLEGCPEVGGDFYFSHNRITSLKNIHKHLKKMNGGFYANVNPIKSHVLGLLKIPGCTKVEIDNDEVAKIINKYLPLGDLLDCQEELIEAGFEEFAQL